MRASSSAVVCDTETREYLGCTWGTHHAVGDTAVQGNLFIHDLLKQENQCLRVSLSNSRPLGYHLTPRPTVVLAQHGIVLHGKIIGGVDQACPPCIS